LTELRAASRAELELLEVLLTRDFPGATQLLAQLSGLEVAVVDDDGSLSLRSHAGSKAESVTRRVVTEGQYPDGDGQPVHVLLHVLDGRLHELEFFREDGRTVMQRLPAHLQDFVPDPW
jgi:hypothetical protein